MLNFGHTVTLCKISQMVSTNSPLPIDSNCPFGLIKCPWSAQVPPECDLYAKINPLSRVSLIVGVTVGVIKIILVVFKFSLILFSSKNPTNNAFLKAQMMYFIELLGLIVYPPCVLPLHQLSLIDF